MTQWIYDWPQIIRDLQADAYTAGGKRDVRKAASKWVTCACGNLSPFIERDKDGAPRDDLLAWWGGYFTWAIRDLCLMRTARDRAFHASRARNILRHIDQREARLLEGGL